MVTIEGIDAAGKNTQSLLLAESLSKSGLKTVHMSFPDYETSIGKEIRAFLSDARSYPVQLQHMLFAANRWEKLEEIRSHLRAGDMMIINRYTESNLAYGRANGLDIDWLDNLEKGMPKADLVIVLDASPQSLHSRRPVTRKDAYEKSSALQSKAQNAYRDLAMARGWKLLNANGSVRQVHKTVLETVRSALSRDRSTSV
jgi:dTMP kinase